MPQVAARFIHAHRHPRVVASVLAVASVALTDLVHVAQLLQHGDPINAVNVMATACVDGGSLMYVNGRLIL